MAAKLQTLIPQGSGAQVPVNGNAESVRADLHQLKGNFLASLNHELRTPLSGALGMMDLLLETSLDEEQLDYVRTARECTNQLLGTLNSILEYSSISSGNIQLNEEEFDLRQELESIVAGYRDKASLKHLHLESNLDHSLPETVVGDALHLRLALTHILDNAVKFTNEGRVSLTAHAAPLQAGCLLEVQVQDTGVGIYPEKIHLIFDSFHQLESGLSRPYTGLGLGLAIVEKMLRLMGGSIHVESLPGEGSLFCIKVPFGVPHCLEVADPAPAPTDVRRILVVEDNKVAQQVVTHLLHRAHYQVTCVNSGKEGIQAAGASRFDLVLMDLQMPGMDGFQAATFIRALPGYADCPIVALTANYSEQYRLLCVENGMQGFLSKPIDKHEFLLTLEKLLP